VGKGLGIGAEQPEADFPLQSTDYYPFGLEIPVYGDCDNQIKYNSKELQNEADLSWYDYGARFYDPVIGRWHAVDPMAEKSRRWSPFTYALDNPIRFIDPDGMEIDVYITGDAAAEATKQLQQSTSLKLSRDSQTGKIEATGRAKSKSDKQLLAAINDENIDVNVTASNSLQTSTGLDYIGGAFMGNKIIENTSTLDIPELNFSIELSGKSIEASQEVNPNMLEYYDNAAGTNGAFMKHEVTEAYEGAKISLSTGIEALPAIKGNATYNSIYLPAHDAASKQPAITSSDVNSARNYAVAKPLMKNMLNLLNIIK